VMSSLNAFFEKPGSPLRQQKSLDAGTSSHIKHTSLASKLLGHHKTITIGTQQSPLPKN